MQQRGFGPSGVQQRDQLTPAEYGLPAPAGPRGAVGEGAGTEVLPGLDGADFDRLVNSGRDLHRVPVCGDRPRRKPLGEGFARPGPSPRPAVALATGPRQSGRRRQKALTG